MATTKVGKSESNLSNEEKTFSQTEHSLTGKRIVVALLYFLHIIGKIKILC